MDIKHIPNSPLIDAITEFRFTPAVDKNAVFGILYQQLMIDFDKVGDLPVIQIPEHIREKDPNLKYSPHHKLKHKSNTDIIVQVGPNILSVSSSPKYIGWAAYSNIVLALVNILAQSNVVERYERVGLRYINFFPALNIFDKNTNIEFSLTSSPNLDISKRAYFRTTINEADNILSTIQIMSDATVTLPNKEATGSILDIDTFTETIEKKNIPSIIEGCHNALKKEFINFLTENFLKTTLNAE